MKLKTKMLIIDDCDECNSSYWDDFSLFWCAKTGYPLGNHMSKSFPIPGSCPLPDVEGER